MSNTKIAIVIPVYNEEENLPALMQRLIAGNAEFGKKFRNNIY